MKKILLLLAMLFGMVSGAKANSYEDVMQQHIGAIHNTAFAIATVQASSGTIGATLYYTGTSTEADVTINQAGITFFAPFNVPDTSVFPVSLSFYDFSVATATMGNFCAAVNASANYKCLLGGLRTDQRATLLLDVTATSGVRNLKTAGGFQVGVDTGGVTGTLTAGLLGPTTSFQLAVGMSPVQQQHRVVLRKCTANTADATGLNLRVYGQLRQYESGGNAGIGTGASGQTTNYTIAGWTGNPTDATMVDSVPLTLNTDGSVDYTAGQTITGLEFAKGAHVVVQTGTPPNGTVGNGATNYLKCLWDEQP